MKRQTTYHKYEDPSHGWLKVKRAEISRLGLEEKISFFSYERGDYVFLEEDDDASAFHNEKTKRGEDYKVIYHHTERECKIRMYARYKKKEPPDLTSAKLTLEEALFNK